MDNSELLQKLYRAGFTRVERDDRLLDVFPDETREWGVELWELWTKKEAKILRIRLPYSEKKLKLYVISKSTLERLLQDNKTAELNKFPIAAF